MSTALSKVDENTRQCKFHQANDLANLFSDEKLTEIMNEVLDAADSLENQPYKGQIEPLLEHLGLQHRRLIAGYFKILYRVVGDYIYVTDIFDSRQDPEKMKR